MDKRTVLWVGGRGGPGWTRSIARPHVDTYGRCFAALGPKSDSVHPRARPSWIRGQLAFYSRRYCFKPYDLDRGTWFMIPIQIIKMIWWFSVPETEQNHTKTVFSIVITENNPVSLNFNMFSVRWCYKYLHRTHDASKAIDTVQSSHMCISNGSQLKNLKKKIYRIQSMLAATD